MKKLNLKQLDFNIGTGLIPAIIQDVKSKDILMLGFMNKEALKETLKIGKVTFWSRKRQCLWTKGKNSGNFLEVIDIKTDCDDDTLLITARPNGPICHTGNYSCFDDINDD